MSGLRKNIERKFQMLSFNQKIVVCLLLVVVFYILWGFLIDETIASFRLNFERESRSLRAGLSDIQGKLDAASEIVKKNPREGLIQEMNEAKKRSDELDGKIHERTIHMISPKEMNKILNEIIQKSKNLQVFNIQSLTHDPLAELKNSDNTQDAAASKAGAEKAQPPKNVEGNKNGPTIFQHTILIELLGGYFETLNFLKALEKNHLNVVWDQIDYTVTQYPMANIKIMVHTLNLDKDWIGV